MGTTLTGTTPQDTYDSLIKVTDNGPLSGTLKKLTDGLGNDSALALSTGAVAIGTTTADSTLTVSSGTVNAVANFKSTDALAYIAIADNASSGALSNYIAVVGDNMYFATNDVERVRVTQNGLTFNGDTAAANALDDYEEGTFNFVIAFGGSDTGITYANRLGAYTKIGRKVTCTGWIRLTSKGSATGLATIGGLPFNIASGNQFYSAFGIGYMGAISFADQVSAYSIINTDRCELVQTSSAGALSALTETNFANNSEIMVNFTYFTA